MLIGFVLGCPFSDPPWDGERHDRAKLRKHAKRRKHADVTC